MKVLKDLLFDMISALVSVLKWNRHIWCETVKAYKSAWDVKIVPSFVGWFAISFMVLYAFFVIVGWHESICIPSVINYIIALYIIFILIGQVFNLCQYISLRDEHTSNSKILLWKTTFWIFSFYTCFILLIGYYESVDTNNQWAQVMTGKFDDWHPVMHTYSIYLLQRILRYKFLVILAFVAFFSHACGWLHETLRRFGYQRNCRLMVIAFIALSPVSLSILRVLWKDTAFGIAVLYMSIYMLHFWHEEGARLHRWQWVSFLCIIVYASFVRHNGFFFTVPFLLFLPFIVRNRFKKIRIVLFSIIAFICLVSYIAFMSYLRTHGIVTQEIPQMFSGSMGVPMCIMSRIMVEQPKAMPQDAYEFMLRICSQEKWKKYYTGDFNSVKFRTNFTRRNVFQTVTPRDFFSMFIRTSMVCKENAIYALIQITSLGIDPFWCKFQYNCGGQQKFILKRSSFFSVRIQNYPIS